MDKFYRLTAQPFSIRILFKPSTEWPDIEMLATQLGEIHVTITVNGIVYPPCNTGIRTTFNAYNTRQTGVKTKESQLFREKLRLFIKSVEDAHTHLEQKKELMDGPSMIRIAKLLRGMNLS